MPRNPLAALPLRAPGIPPWTRTGEPLDLAPVLAALELEHRKISAARVTSVRSGRGVLVREHAAAMQWCPSRFISAQTRRALTRGTSLCDTLVPYAGVLDSVACPHSFSGALACGHITRLPPAHPSAGYRGLRLSCFATASRPVPHCLLGLGTGCRLG